MSCMGRDHQAELSPDGETIRLLRCQRHDFINHLQVLYTLLQMGRTEKALVYIQELAQNPDKISDVLREQGYHRELPENIL